MADFDFEVPSTTPAPATPGAGMIDLCDVIQLLASGSYLVTRRGAGTVVDGVRVAPAATTFTVTASVQPISGLKLDRLPEGIRNKEVMAVFTCDLLRTAEPGVHEADQLSIDGATFEVAQVARWNNLGGYYRCVVARIS